MWHLLSGCDQSLFTCWNSIWCMFVSQKIMFCHLFLWFYKCCAYLLLESVGWKNIPLSLFLLGSLKYILFNTIKHKNSNKSNYKIVFYNLELFTCMHMYMYMYIFTLWLENCMVSFIIKPCKQTFLFFNHKSTSGNF